MNVEELLANWINDNSSKLLQSQIISISRAEPIFASRNYFARYKIETAKLDGSGRNPTENNCFVLEISETDQTANVSPNTECDSIQDL